MTERKLLLGDEAVAQAALDAGIGAAYSYPGTPSTEIMEYIMESEEADERQVHRKWSSNEKTAYEAALGHSYCGLRTMVSMKHVGLNVAADPFVNSAITGIDGGLVLIVADDPSMHSSQNEQDSRFYGEFAGIPVLEPADQQEAYDFTRNAFEISEKFSLPVLVRIVTRIAHTRADVKLAPPQPPANFSPNRQHNRYTLIPLNARKNYQLLTEKREKIRAAAESSRKNRRIAGRDSQLGIIAAGIGFGYLEEFANNGELPHPCLKISRYPLPRQKLRDFSERFEQLLILEDGAPLIEQFLQDAYPRKKLLGRIQGPLSLTGELTPETIKPALNLDNEEQDSQFQLPPRPPKLCPGCPHADSFDVVKEFLELNPKGRAFSDIGCYTLGYLAPYEAIHTCVDMGASITMAKGAADAGLHPSLALIGDSTFTHSGMTGLLDAVYESTNITVLILDNRTTAMTGGQTSIGADSLEDICRGIGVSPEHIHLLKPLATEKKKNLKLLVEESNYDGVSVLILRRACIKLR